MAKNFQDITNKAYVALAAGYGIEGAFPIDLRTVLPGTTMLEALIHNNMVYEGMFVYIAGTVYICKPKFHSAVWNPDGDIAASKGKYYLDEELTQPITDGTASGTTVYSDMLWYEEYQVESSSVQTATQADKLSHNVVINGKATNFAVPTGEDVTTIDTGLFTPETIEAGTNIDTITHCGFYSYTDANESANNYSLLIEKIGNKLYRTKITIENGVPVVSTSVQIGTQGDTVIWGEWMRLGIGKCITTCTSQSLHATSVGGNHVALDINIGSTPELWVYSDSTATYPQGYANIHTADGQVFTIAAQSPAIPHPFVVKLKTANDGTRTAAVESLKATNDKYGTVRFGDDSMKGTSVQRGFVKLSDAINDNTLGENNGVAATPKAVATLNERITKTNDMVAPGFSEETAYAIGNRVTYNGNLYRCTAAHSAGAWNNAHFTQVTVDRELNAEAATRDEQMKSIGVGKVYRATYSGTVSGGVFNVVWETTPTTINIGDIVIIKYTTAQPVQMAAIHLQVGSTYYEIAVGTLAANTTAYYHCSKTPTGSSTATAGELQTDTSNGRLGVVEAKLGVVEVKLAKIPIGMIVMWSGSNVPTGWALCDGTNGTPDLRNRFIMGGVLSEQTGYEVKGSTGGTKSNTIGIDNLPAHSHIYVGDANIPPHWVWSDSLNGFVVDNNEDGKKLYDKYGMEIYFPHNNHDRGTWGDDWNNNTSTNWTDASRHNWGASGSGGARLYLSSSTIYAKGNRTATYGTRTPDAIENRPPYYALAFIMFKG